MNPPIKDADMNNSLTSQLPNHLTTQPSNYVTIQLCNHLTSLVVSRYFFPKLIRVDSDFFSRNDTTPAGGFYDPIRGRLFQSTIINQQPSIRKTLDLRTSIHTIGIPGAFTADLQFCCFAPLLFCLFVLLLFCCFALLSICSFAYLLFCLFALLPICSFAVLCVAI